MLDSSIWEDNTSSRYAERLLKAQEPQYVGLAMSVTQLFGTSLGMEVFELNYFIV